MRIVSIIIFELIWTSSKKGMLASMENVDAIAETLVAHHVSTIVLDPVRL